MSKPTGILLTMLEEQQAELADALISGMTYWQAIPWLQEKFGVTVKSISAFTPFWAAWCEPRLLARRRRAVHTSEEIAEEASKNPGQFDAATIDAIKQRAFELSISPGCNPKDVKNLFALVLKSRDQERANKELDLEREKFDRLKRQDEESRKVATNPTLTAEEKQQRMREILGIS